MERAVVDPVVPKNTYHGRSKFKQHSKANTYLIYEFAENGSLDDWFHTKNNKKYHNSLNWKHRVHIAHDIDNALNYLHNYTNPPYIHKNLKSENLLLDSNFRAKVSNFGFVRVLDDEEEGFQVKRHVIGTQVYMLERDNEGA